MLDPMDCMRDGVPPLLLIDLFGAAGPDAAHIYSDEPADVSWTHPAIHEVAPERLRPEVAGQLPMALIGHLAGGTVALARSQDLPINSGDVTPVGAAAKPVAGRTSSGSHAKAFGT